MTGKDIVYEWKTWGFEFPQQKKPAGNQSLDDVLVGMIDAAIAQAVASKQAEIDMLRGIGCEEDGDGPCGVCIKCKVAAEREACADIADSEGDVAFNEARPSPKSGEPRMRCENIANAIRARTKPS